MSSPLMSDPCGRCGNRYGLHSGVLKCPVGRGFHATDSFTPKAAKRQDVRALKAFDGQLTEGKRYSLLEPTDAIPYRHFLGDKGTPVALVGGWHEFVEIVDALPYVEITISAQDAGVPEWKRWRDAGRTPDECSCRIPRKDCWIHRRPGDPQ